MQKYFAEGTFYPLPSGNNYHPARLIIRDGTLTWKDALHCRLTNKTYIPSDLAHEQHIIKTAQRMEELNTWASINMELWECIKPVQWYNPTVEGFEEGITLKFKHLAFSNKLMWTRLVPHIKPHESLTSGPEYLSFKRC